MDIITKEPITPFLTFPGNAEDAINYYLSVFPDAKLQSLTRITEKEHGEIGKLLNGTFTLMGVEFLALDMEKKHAVDFTWATSFFINCRTEAEFDHLFIKLSEGGSVMMGPESLFGMRKVAWVTDKFGVTWQPIWK